MHADPERIAVIVGVGQHNDRPADPADGVGPLALMTAALIAADADAGGGWLGDLDDLAVIEQIGFPGDDPFAAKLAQAIGATAAQVHMSDGPNGDSPVLLLDEAANRIARGEIGIAAVVGGEALRTASVRARAATTEHNALRRVTANPDGYRQRYGLSAPVDIYPLYENATRAAWGQTLAQGQAETGALWAKLSEVAAASPGAWLRTRRTPAEIVTPNADNRPIAFPYTKLMVANTSVNQGAGFLITSLAEARRRGVPDHRLIYVGRGARACEPSDILARAGYLRSVSMEVCLRRALEWNGVDTTGPDLVELYSCFPCVSKMARRAIGWPLDRPTTVFGGLTFGGGPVGNYMSHAVAAMVDRLRAGEGQSGLLFANGGFATRNHAIVLTTTPPARAGIGHSFDCQSEADAARVPIPPLAPNHVGAAMIETYTIFYGRDGTPSGGVIVARTADGSRTLARVAADDRSMIAHLTDGTREPIGTDGAVIASTDLRMWRHG